ncbi:MAG: peptidoglycan DD-metalloendopeptidase family protein [Acutalibacteraceae bacterium]
MSTKFIGINGFDNIETMGAKTEYRLKIKRFLRRIIRNIKKSKKGENSTSFKRTIKNLPQVAKLFALGVIYLVIMIPQKVKGILKTIWSFFKKIIKSVKEFSVKDFISSLTPKKVAVNFLLPAGCLAVLCFTVAFWTQYIDFGLSVKVDGQEVTTVENEAVLQKANEIVASKTLESTESDFTPVYEVKFIAGDGSSVENATDASDSIISSSAEVVDNASGLYINGKFYGAVSEEEDLSGTLDKMLADYKESYDDKTTTEFYNDVEVIKGVFPADAITNTDAILEQAESENMLGIMLATDIKSKITVDYKTKVKYDKSQPSSYSKVTQKGEKGRQIITYRAYFLDGVQIDAVETGRKVLKKSVTKIVVEGSKTYSSQSSSQSSASSSESSGYSESTESKSSYSAPKSSGGFIWPVPAIHTISSGYGYRSGGMHGGIDISNGNSYGKTIVASDSGTVTFSGYDSSGYGNYVIIDHGNGYETLYGHCSALYVSRGQSVSQGEAIAAVGSTGQSTGNHCHFEIRSNGSRLNPLSFVSP